MTRLLIGLAALAFLIWLAMASLFTIGQSQQALVVRLGQPVAALTDPGLHLKAPLIDTVQYYDNRLLQLEPGVQQIILGDQKRIEVETYARFRIVDPLRYFQSVGTDEQARSQLSQMISAYLRRELGQVMLPALLSQQRDAITEKIRAAVASDAKPLGIEVVDVRIRRADLPVETSQAIYDRMMSERNREAKELRAQGFEWAQQIRAKAEHDRTVLLSEAQRDARNTRGQGEAEANRISAAAFGKDPAFYDLYRTLQAYRTALAPGAPTVMLSPASSFMRYFQAGPPVGQNVPASVEPKAP
jgi:membrane protease subunit HflC